MKKLFKNIKISFCLFALSAISYAQTPSPVAVVNSVKGDVFMTQNGKTSKLRDGQFIYDLATIVTAIDGQVSFNDYFDHRYHLASSGQVRLFNRTIELHRGYFWIQSLGQHNQGFSVETANSRLNYATGDGVLSFDSESGLSQFMSISGTFEFGNLEERELNVMVRSGEFSLVDSAHNEGVPRRATPAGEQTLGRVIAMFEKAKTTSSGAMASAPRPAASRAPASVQEDRPSQSGKIVFIPLTKKQEKDFFETRMKLTESYSKPSGRAPASVGPSKAAAGPKRSNVPVHIFGQPPARKAVAARAPASVKSPVEQLLKEARKPASVQTNEFESALMESYKKQMRHTPEVNSLIRDLKNYNMDRNPSY